MNDKGRAPRAALIVRIQQHMRIPLQHGTLLFALPLLLMACTPAQDAATSLDAKAFAVRIGEGNAQLVDVRTPAEYAQGYLANAVNLDWTSGQLEAQAGTLDKSKPVLLYCASGRRSASAREHLAKEGFTDVVDLSGGIYAWEAQGQPVAH